MGNLLACFGAPKDKNGKKPSSRSQPPTGERRVCQGYEPVRTSPSPAKLAPPVAAAASGGGAVGAELRDHTNLQRGCIKQKNLSTDGPQQPSFGSPNQVGTSSPKQVSFSSPKEAKVNSLKHDDLNGPKQVSINSPKQGNLSSPKLDKLSSPNQVAFNSSKQLNFNSPKKKVTFDLNVKTYEDHTTCEKPSSCLDADEPKETIIKEGNRQKEEGILTFPPNHRYQNCTSSDDENSDEEVEEFDDEEDELDNCDISGRIDEEESFDSYFSLQMDKEREMFKEVSSTNTNSITSVDQKPSLLRNQGVRDRSNYVHSVLNPVENLSQWKEVKAGKLPTKHSKKENIGLLEEPKILVSPEPNIQSRKPHTSFDSSPNSNSSAKHEVSVDTSLSNWLTPPRPRKGSHENDSYTRSNTLTSLDDRPILGALTVDDIKQSKSPSPRKSPSMSPDEMPIMGTVGRYWNHTGQELDSASSCSSSDLKGIPNTTSKYREDRQVNWHSTPFEVRLERALSKGSAGAYSSFPSSAVC